MDTVIVRAPSSKSLSHRVLIGAALAKGESQVSGILESRDLECTRSVLEAAGVAIQRLEHDTYLVQGSGGKLYGAGPALCNVHESGTTCRLMTAVLASGQGEFFIHGADRMHQRPMGELLAVLRSLGTEFHCQQKPDHAPFILKTNGLAGGKIDLGMDESSQYLSGMLLAAPQAKSPLYIELGGKAVVSWPYIGLTLHILEEFGIHFSVEEKMDGNHENTWRQIPWRTIKQAIPGKLRFLMRPSTYKAGQYTVEGDWSGASYLLAAGALGQKAVRVEGLLPNSLQGDRAMLDILQAMGAKVEYEAQAITVYPSLLKGANLNMAHCPDLVPTVASLAAAATGNTLISGCAHLRIKECDRIKAPVTELGLAGVVAQEREDGMEIQGRGPKAFHNLHLQLHAWGDHRIAMGLSLLECLGAKVHIDHPEVVSKSFPDYWKVFGKIVA